MESTRGTSTVHYWVYSSELVHPEDSSLGVLLISSELVHEGKVGSWEGRVLAPITQRAHKGIHSAVESMKRKG